jgi:hypothetical protein
MSIQATIIKNGTTRLILTGTDGIDNEVLKQLDGATVKFVSDNLKIFDKNISGGLVLEMQLNIPTKVSPAPESQQS